jgi:hypothetical protein
VAVGTWLGTSMPATRLQDMDTIILAQRLRLQSYASPQSEFEHPGGLVADRGRI